MHINMYTDTNLSYLVCIYIQGALDTLITQQVHNTQNDSIRILEMFTCSTPHFTGISA